MADRIHDHLLDRAGSLRQVGPAADVQGAARAGGDPPGNYETGTLAAVSYLAGIGQQYGKEYRDRFPGLSGRRLDLKTGMTVLREHDHVLSAAILDELETLPGVRIHGITDRNRLGERVPTVSFTWGKRPPREIAAALGH